MVLGRPLRVLLLSAVLPLMSFSLSAAYCSDAEREAESATLRCPPGPAHGPLAGVSWALPTASLGYGPGGGRWAQGPGPQGAKLGSASGWSGRRGSRGVAGTAGRCSGPGDGADERRAHRELQGHYLLVQPAGHHQARQVKAIRQQVEAVLARHEAVRWHSEQRLLKRTKRGVHFNDPKYPQQWHLVSPALPIPASDS